MVRTRKNLSASEIASNRWFAERQCVPVGADANPFSLHVHALCECLAHFSQGYSIAMEDAATAESTCGICAKLLMTAHDHLETAFAAWATERLPTAEAIARVALEASSIPLYIVADPSLRDTRVASYLWSYVADTRRKFDEVKRASKIEREGQRELESAALARRTAGEHVASILLDLFENLGVSLPVEDWPNVWHRFQRAGLGSTYLTVYAALSSQVHGVPEDLVHQLLVSSHQDYSKKQKIENGTFSLEMLCGVADIWTLAALCVARSYGFTKAATAIRMVRAEYGLRATLSPPR